MRISILIGNRDLERGSDLEKGAAEKGKTFSLPSQLNSKGQQNQMDGACTRLSTPFEFGTKEKENSFNERKMCMYVYIY
jgi:hypothetical protein